MDYSWIDNCKRPGEQILFLYFGLFILYLSIQWFLFQELKQKHKAFWEILDCPSFWAALDPKRGKRFGNVLRSENDRFGKRFVALASLSKWIGRLLFVIVAWMVTAFLLRW